MKSYISHILIATCVLALAACSDSVIQDNSAIVNNTGGSQPQQDQNPGLRDGVTD